MPKSIPLQVSLRSMPKKWRAICLEGGTTSKAILVTVRYLQCSWSRHHPRAEDWSLSAEEIQGSRIKPRHLLSHLPASQKQPCSTTDRAVPDSSALIPVPVSLESWLQAIKRIQPCCYPKHFFFFHFIFYSLSFHAPGDLPILFIPSL